MLSEEVWVLKAVMSSCPLLEQTLASGACLYLEAAGFEAGHMVVAAGNLCAGYTLYYSVLSVVTSLYFIPVLFISKRQVPTCSLVSDSTKVPGVCVNTYL